MRLCPKTSNTCYSSGCALECWMQPLLSVQSSGTQIPNGPKIANITLDELRSIYASLGRAIESGDPLQIGLILGQVYKELEKYVNTDTTRDDSATVPINTEGSAIQSGPTFGSGSIFSGKTPDISPDTE